MPKKGGFFLYYIVVEEFTIEGEIFYNDKIAS